MAELVGIFAASHTPVMLNFPDMASGEDRAAVFGAFGQLGERMAAARPDIVIVVSDDHLHNFFLDNLPSFCVGAAETYPTPIEHWLKAEQRELPGAPDFSAHILQTAFEEGFDPAFAMQLHLDHGTLTPLELSGLDRTVRIVPLLINCVQPPLPTMLRAVQWGQMLRKAITSFPLDCRIAILGTGGLSHDVGTPRMGMLNVDFDERFLALLADPDPFAAAVYAQDNVDTAGNGAEEVRNWLVAHGAAPPGSWRPIFYRGVAEWYTGIGIGEWIVN